MCHAKAYLTDKKHAPVNSSYQATLHQVMRRRSCKQIYWLCKKCPAGQQHSWSAAPNSRTGRSKHGCPCCAGKAACQCNSLQALHTSIAAEWDHGKNKGQPSDHTAGSQHMAWWSSPQRGSWQQTINSRTNNIHKQSVSSSVLNGG